MKTSVGACVLAFLGLGFAAHGQGATTVATAGTATVIDAPEFQARRRAALE
jgi:hypothetical protein